MLKIKLHKDKIIDYKEEKNKIYLNDQEFNWDLRIVGPLQFHIIKDNKSYSAEIIEIIEAEKKVSIKVNNDVYHFELKDKYDVLLDALGINQTTSKKIQNVKAPMPGLILDIKIQEGQEVKTGDPLLILEAMKMENIIKATGDGIVKAIKVKKGQSVEKNQPLIEF